MTRPKNSVEYHLFLDESGQFEESSTDLNELSRGESQIFPSQLVGFLALHQPNIDERAYQILKKSFAPDRLRVQVHASEIKDRTKYISIIRRLINELGNEGWQPVRLVNKEKMVYGPRSAVYTNMVAELILRILQSVGKTEHDTVRIRLTAGKVFLDETLIVDAKSQHRKIEKAAYEQRIREYLGYIMVQRGLTKENFKWSFQGVQLKDAKYCRPLQICDLLSNASHDDYKKLKDSKSHLEKAFGIFDQTMETSDIIDRIEFLINRQALSSALIILAEVLVDSRETNYFHEVVKKNLDYLLVALVQIDTRGRNAHLALLIAWLDQIIGQQRKVGIGYRIVDWMLTNVVAPLRLKLRKSSQENSIDWFEFAINRWALTAANHQGALLNAHEASEAMARLGPSLARQGEHIPLLIEGFIVQSVHQTDCFDFSIAISQLEWITKSLRIQSQLMNELMPELVKEQLHSDIRAKALGTLTLSLILSGWTNEESIVYARSKSDEAIDEFVHAQDKKRQYQYRAHLETMAGDFASARWFLIRSLRSSESYEDTTYKTLLETIDNFEDKQSFDYFFTLSHWLRMGAVSARNNAPEFEDFYAIFESSTFGQPAWIESLPAVFPTHLILKFLAVIQASRGHEELALKTLRQLEKITKSSNNYLILPLIQVAACAEVAGTLLTNSDSLTASYWLLDSAQKTLEISDAPQNGIKQILEKLQKKQIEKFPTIKRKIHSWLEEIKSLNLESEGLSKSQEVLFRLADEIRY